MLRPSVRGKATSRLPRGILVPFSIPTHLKQIGVLIDYVKLQV
jgi:hypothetical protein